jgi:hypothetical protein
VPLPRAGGDRLRARGRLFFYADRTASSTAFSAETAYQLVRATDGRWMASQPQRRQGAGGAARVRGRRARAKPLLPAGAARGRGRMAVGGGRLGGFAHAGLPAAWRRCFGRGARGRLGLVRGRLPRRRSRTTTCA